MRRKMLITIALIMIMLCNSVIPLVGVVNAATYVEITLNSELYIAVKSSLQAQGISASYSSANRTITISETALASVTYLDLSNGEIDDLTGLSSFYNVTELNLTANELTVDSNLSELDSLTSLTNLNLSSNKLASVSSITTFDSITYTDITNQELTTREIITVDISEESTYTKTYTVSLPDILLKDTGSVEAEWIDAEVETEADGATTKPYVNWASINGTSLTLTVASGNGEEYTSLNGLISITVNIEDSSSKLKNTKMTLYYAIIDSDETGIIFNDTNLYTAVRDQLTAGQTENSELKSYGNDGTTLYIKNYDAPLILVIDTNTLINKIPSLVLNDKRITDLTGLEEFVGLESELNLSYNYIDSIDKIIELEENKEAKESELQEKYSKYLEYLSNYRSELTNYKTELEEIAETIAEIEAEIEDIKDVDTSAGEVVDQDALDAANEKLIAAKLEYETCETKVEKYEELVSEIMEKLYTIYNKEYLLTSILPLDVCTLSYDEIYPDGSTDRETFAGYAESIISYISELEESGSLTEWESDLIINKFGITTTQTVTDSDGNTITEEIENPISAYFELWMEGSELFTISKYQDFIYNMKVLDAQIIVGNYCLINSLYDEDSFWGNAISNKNQYIGYTSGTDIYYCSWDEGIDELKEFLESFGLDTYFVNLVGPTDVCAACTDLWNCRDLDNLWSGTSGAEYAYIDYDAVNELFYAISGKLVNASDKIETFVKLPRLQNLNLEDNSIESLAGLEALSSLKTLNAYKNLLDDISDVYWSGLILLENLNLGYNQLTDVNDLEVLTNLQTLNLSKNLLSGSFDFYLAGMSYLTSADFSYNQISDIAYFTNQFKFLAKSAIEKGYVSDVYEYVLSSYCPSVSFQYQTLSLSTTATLDGSFITLDLPSIFEQAESIDYSRTSFGIDSLLGTVEADGTTVKLYTPSTGSYTAYVTIEGNNGSSSGESSDGIAFGTICTICYNMVDYDVTDADSSDGGDTGDASTTSNLTADSSDISLGGSSTMTYTYSGDSIDADNVEITWTMKGNTSANTTLVEQGEVVSSSTEVYENAVFTYGADETSEEITVTVYVEGDDTSVWSMVWKLESDNNSGGTNVGTGLTYGYTVADEYVYVTTPGITVSTFSSNLLDSDDYTITVVNNSNATDYLATGAVVTVDDSSGETVDALEVVVLGDVNGDGEIDALDSGIVRNVRNEVTTLVGSYEEAADVNQDGEIDYTDSLLILYYRAEKINSFSN